MIKLLQYLNHLPKTKIKSSSTHFIGRKHDIMPHSGKQEYDKSWPSEQYH